MSGEPIIVALERVEVPAEKREPVTTSAKMLDILAMIEDPERPVSEINRAIAAEIASATGDIGSLEQSSGYKLSFLKERVKALRELAKTLTESDVLSKKDILNFDGPKFQFVFQEIVGVIRKSAKDAGLAEDQVNSVLRQFRDIMAQKEPELRKQTERVDSTFKR